MRTPARALGRWAVRAEGEGLLVGEGLSRLARQQCAASRCCRHAEGMIGVTAGEGRHSPPGLDSRGTSTPADSLSCPMPGPLQARSSPRDEDRSGAREVVVEADASHIPVEWTARRCRFRPGALRGASQGIAGQGAWQPSGRPAAQAAHGLEAAATDGPDAMTVSRCPRLRGHPTTMVPVLSGGPQIAPRVVDDVQPGAVGLAPRHLSRRGAKVDRFAIGPVALQ